MLRLSRLVAAGYLILCLVSVGLMAVIGPLGYAPYPLPLGPSREPIGISIAYSVEKEPWLKEAVGRFNAEGGSVNGRPIRISLEPATESRETLNQIARGERTPVAFSPASSLQIELLQSAWEATGKTGKLVGDEPPLPLVLSPLVIVAWQERATLLWQNEGAFWNDLHDAVAADDGWVRFGKPEWGLVKFSHARPTRSDSGIQTLVLLAYGYHNKASGLTSGDIDNPDFQKWLLDIEKSVIKFDDNGSSLMQSMVLSGPGTYDLATVYENVALQDIDKGQSRSGQDLHIYYPPVTVISDHPFVVLNAPWVTPAQREAALAFRNYLLGPEMQRLALQHGFRPANAAVALVSDDPNNPFNKYQRYGLQIYISQQVALPAADVLNKLSLLWQEQVNR